MEYQPDDRYWISVDFASDPDRADEIVERIFDAVERLQALGPSAEETAAVKEGQLGQYQGSIRLNTFWSTGFRTSELRREDPVDRILRAPVVIEALTPAIIRDAAATLLDIQNYVRLTVRPDPNGPAGDESGEWLSLRQIQERVDLETAGGYYPSQIEGRLRSGQSEFRASFAAFPPGFRFQSHWGFDQSRFAARDAELTAQGFERVWTQEFTDGAGTTRLQGTWVRIAR
jgi:Bacterial tandem repeat domain 1